MVDSAEIPTLQERGAVDTDQDGTISTPEAARYAQQQCTALAQAAPLTVEGKPVAWRTTSSSYTLAPGSAGLPTSRLTCKLSAPATLTKAARIHFADTFRDDRIGWHEITAAAEGVRIDRSPVPTRSVSDQLRHYPGDLLTSPLDVRSATLQVRPGTGSTTARLPEPPTAGPFTKALSHLTARFNSLAGARHLSLGVGLLAILLAVILGAGHAALPGHGKTVMAAYIAGRRGRTRDALLVGATVTLTHTGGVLILGLLLSASAALAGESLLAYLGAASGLLVTAIGIGLLRSAWRPHHAHHGHGHGHGHGQGDGHGDVRFGKAGLIGLGLSGGLVPSPSALVVLLGAIALGRTIFGACLVLAYGLGMAATLTAAGLTLVRLQAMLDRTTLARKADRLGRLTPVATAALVIVVGLGLALRGLNGAL
ncbi:High-affinity nickel-transporter [Actinomadura sp. BRA 177]|nr:High-affinity nickel-transporter [Actinomadura sp. BRA 177]